MSNVIDRRKPASRLSMNDSAADEFELDIHKEVSSLLQNVRDHHNRCKNPPRSHVSVDLRSPFVHSWAYGYNKGVPVLNISTVNESKVVFASGRFPIIYDYEHNTMSTLTGQRNTIHAMDIDRSGRWLATADKGKGNKILLWDMVKCIPIHVIYDFEKTKGVERMWLSPCARYIVLLRRLGSVQALFIYDWSNIDGRSRTKMYLDRDLSKVVAFSFSPEKSEHMMLTSELYAVFLTLEPGTPEEPPKLRFHNAGLDHKLKVGDFTSSTYFTDSHYCYTGTSAGYVIAWSDLDYFNMVAEEVSNMKNSIDHFLVLNCAITAIQPFNNYIVIGSSSGKICFYNEVLHLQYWFEHEKLDAIYNISFNRVNPETSDEELMKMRISKSEFIMSKFPEKEKKTRVKFGCSDATLEAKPFLVEDCIISTVTGQVAYITFCEKRLIFLLDHFVNDVVAIASHPARYYLVLGASTGHVFLLDYMCHEILKKSELPTSITMKRKNTPEGKISILQYSNSGIFLACGLTNGFLIFLHPLILETYRGWDRQYSNNPIKIITFSNDSTICGFTDSEHVFFIQITFNETTLGRPKPIGKFQPHVGRIVSLRFMVEPSHICVSVGKDKTITEYDCSGPEVVIRKVTRMFQRVQPVAVALAPQSKQVFVSTNVQTIKTYDISQKIIVNTKRAPSSGNSITEMEVLNDLSENEYLFFLTKNSAGLIKLPLTVNPYRWISVYISENKVIQCRLSKEKDYIFTLCEGEGTVHVWSVHATVLDTLATQGGQGLQAYDAALGKNGKWIINALKDYFTYANIIHYGEFHTEKRPIRNELPLCEVPDVLRAMGCFLSQNEIENLLSGESAGEKIIALSEHTVTFEKLLEMYINHMNMAKISRRDIENAFRTLCEFKNDDDKESNPMSLTKMDFVSILEEFGEPFKRCETYNFLSTLIKPPAGGKAREEDISRDDSFSFIPEEITYEFFEKEILGVPTVDDLQMLELANEALVNQTRQAIKEMQAKQTRARETSLSLRKCLRIMALRDEEKEAEEKNQV